MKLKKSLASLMAVSCIIGAIPVTNVSAANDPKVYVDITYDDNGKVRADVMFKNIPACAAGDFHIDVGDGWNIVHDENNEIPLSQNNPSNDVDILSAIERDDNYFLIYFVNREDKKLSDCFCSFYLEKKSNFNSKNAEVNVIFENSGTFDDFIATKDGDYLISSGTYRPPVMLEAQEYIIGDANNDGYVNAIDGSWILSSVELNPQCKVDDIIETYKNIFPQANCAAAPDANLDGVISQADFDLIMEYYIDMSTDERKNSRVGKREFYEIFQKN